MLKEFTDYKNLKLKDLIIEINRLEEEGDRMYVEAVRKLHTTVTDAIEIFAWSRVYYIFEKCCDVCEDVADIVERITIGNS